MVILAQAMQPSESNAAVAQQMGVSLDEFGFVAPSEDLLNPSLPAEEEFLPAGSASPHGCPRLCGESIGRSLQVAEVLASCS